MNNTQKLPFASRYAAAMRRATSQRKRSGTRIVDRCLRVLALVSVSLLPISAKAQVTSARKIDPGSPEVCRREAEGSVLPEAKNLRSRDGLLEVELTFRNVQAANGETRYCYTLTDGSEAPTLRLNPGDTLVIRIKNQAVATVSSSVQGSPAEHAMMHKAAEPSARQQTAVHDACKGGPMSTLATNLHFHGLTLSPVCHQDDVLNTLIEPGDAAFEYRLQVPFDTPPGLYWYHPHPHGFSAAQVSGGACGALIVEGAEKQHPALSGLPERVLVIRDQLLLYPSAKPLKTDSMPAPQVIRDAEGDVMNTGVDGGRPARDLTLNFVPVAFPEYKPAVIPVRAGERQFWRLLNASAITYLDVQLLANGAPQMLGVVALDGVALNQRGPDAAEVLWQSHLLIPPAGRVEFILNGLQAGVKAALVTRRVDTGPLGENDPTRPLADLQVNATAMEPPARLPVRPYGEASKDAKSSAKETDAITAQQIPWLGTVEPQHTRKLYFSEQAERPDDPSSPTKFYLTVDGEAPTQFDPNADSPNIVVRQGDVEDWIIENRTRELHTFHIHQIHFLLEEWNGVPLEEPYLRDTVNVAYWDGQSRDYPKVKLRMDFRDKRIVGTFPYHCHLLEHEDGGMMGTVQVVNR